MRDTIQVRPEAGQEIQIRLNTILQLMELEHKHASTHSQRNAYQAVIRREIEVLRDDITNVYPGNQKDSDIPF